MIGKKINQLATELAPVSTDLTIIGDPISGVSKKITLAQLGAIFSGAVSFYTDLASFPATGDINVIYCAKDTQKLYLWSGSAYVEVFPSQALLDTYQLRSEKGNANGYASLDSGGKVPISQLPSSIMEYKGTWNASTNTPTLANGTGDTGDVYICNVAGTVNFGAGPLTFAVGDYVIYSGTIWQRSSGAVGTVTSVALTVGGDAISVSGSPLTTSGTLALAFSGTTSQYIRGNGTLANFPTSLISGTGNVNAIPKFTDNTVLGNSVMEDDGNFVSMRGLKLNLIAGTGNSINFQQASGIIAAGLGYSSIGAAGSTGIKFYLDQNSTTRSFVLDTTTITSDTERTYSMPNSSGTLALTSDIPSLTGYVPYTGATANVDLGTHTLLAKNLVINHSSGSGVAASITKGGSGEALTVVKSSGSGNAASITGGVTLLSELHLTTDLADAYIASATNWNTAYSLRITSATSPLSITSNVISIAQASGSTNGYLSSTDWTTFNNKQNALTNPVTGTGTTNYLPKFTGASTIGDSVIQEASSNIGIGGSPSGTYGKLSVFGGLSIKDDNNAKLEIGRYSSGASNSYIKLGANSNSLRFTNAGDLADIMELTNSGNLGLGVTPSAWGTGSSARALQMNAGSLFSFSTSQLHLEQNSYFNSGFFYVNNGFASAYRQVDGAHSWHLAPSGTAGNAISFTQAMTLDASGNLLVGGTSDSYITSSRKVLGITGTSEALISFRASGTAMGYIFAYASAIDISAIGRDFTVSAGTSSPTERFRIAASTGAATFSSSVTAGGLLTTAYTSTGSSMGHFIVNTAASTLSNSADIWFGTWGGSTISGITNARISALNVNAGNAATDLLFYTWNGSSSGERFRIASSGAATFSSSVDIGQSATVRGFTGTTGAGMFMAYGSAGAGIGSIYSYNYGTSTYGGTVIDGSYVAFYNSGSEKMRVTGGNVGIGTSSPNRLLDVNGVIRTQNSGSAGAPSIELGTSSQGNGLFYPTTNTIAIATNDNERMRITSGGDIIIGYNQTTTTTIGRTFATTHASANRGATLFYGINDGGFGGMYTYNVASGITGYNAQYIAFYTHEGAVSSGERMRITSTGVVLIGSTTSLYTDTNRGVLEVNGTSSAIVGLTIGGTNGGYLLHSGTDLSIWNAKNGAAIFGTNNTERLRITSGGIVQVNTTASIGGGVMNLNGDLRFGGSAGASYSIINYQGGSLNLGTNNATNLTIASTGAATFSSSVSVNGDLIIRKSGTQYGTLYASSGNDLFLESANSAAIYYNSVASLHTWRNNGSNAMSLTSTGLGIGTTSPSHTLDVTGTGRFTSDVKVKTLEITNVGTYGSSAGISTYMAITVNGQNYVIPLHGTP